MWLSQQFFPLWEYWMSLHKIVQRWVRWVIPVCSTNLQKELYSICKVVILLKSPCIHWCLLQEYWSSDRCFLMIQFATYSSLSCIVLTFTKSWYHIEALRIKFLGFNFRGEILYFNFELSTQDANFGFNKERVARLSLERVWLRETRGKMECWTRGTGPVFRLCFCLLHLSVHFLHHHTWNSLRKETLQIKGTANRAQVAKQRYKNAKC